MRMRQSQGGEQENLRKRGCLGNGIQSALGRKEVWLAVAERCWVTSRDRLGGREIASNIPKESMAQQRHCQLAVENFVTNQTGLRARL